MKTPYYITTPIYYVNAKPHIGTAYTSIAADTLARFMRLDGREVKFLTGTDEHGQKVEQSAMALGMTPQKFVDEISEEFRKLGALFDFTNDVFMRTTGAQHKKSAQALWMRLVERDQIYKSSYAGWYSVRDEAFYNDDEVKDGKAPNGSEVTWVEEPCYFFKLSEWTDKLLELYETNPDFVAPKSRLNEIKSFVKGGLTDLCISRSTFKWGVPVPNDPDHIMYVWVDALPNYINALGFPDETSADFQKFWPQAIHIMGKDIIRFHGVYWPALLMAAGLPLPKRLFAHGWWTNEGQKISKSLGNTIDPFEVAEAFGTDQIRYFLLSSVTFGRDADYSQESLITKCNADLANDIGNLVQRVLSFAYKNASAQIPKPSALSHEDHALLKAASALPEKVCAHAEVQALHKMCEEIWAVVSLANKYVDHQEPWALRKTDVDRMNTVLYVLAETIRHIAILAQCIIPKAAAQILDQLAVPVGERQLAHLDTPLAFHQPIPQPQGVFPRIVMES
jgi:methionyl-tRNA synthetase